jgi:predicted RNA-binding protein
MCETAVFSVADGRRKQLMDNVSLIVVDGDEVTVSGVLGGFVKARGRITRVDLEKHEVLIE